MTAYQEGAIKKFTENLPKDPVTFLNQIFKTVKKVENKKCLETGESKKCIETGEYESVQK